mgnify:CR=1 FL=1
MRKSPIVQFLVSLNTDWITTEQPFNKPNTQTNATSFAIRNKCECIRSFLLQKQCMFVSQITVHTFLNASDCMAFSWRANRTGAGYTTRSGTSSGFKIFYDNN